MVSTPISVVAVSVTAYQTVLVEPPTQSVGSSSATVASVVSSVASNGTVSTATAFSKSSFAGGAATAGDGAVSSRPSTSAVPSVVLTGIPLITSPLEPA